MNIYSKATDKCNFSRQVDQIYVKNQDNPLLFDIPFISDDVIT